ncbi:MAG TPA: AbrB/MazE/SpoVT family DNA-binding domain-containing protein [Chloroflexota bacterium]|jgi:bifunctional DNA-binding transcriptional regulator/antitoxin component of YhaV-PrlF toxin-antitoxin module|nr:AbrB/MazE/SpoVT family DNA-binding domain-containing protein [Chloroflexota bacterium]
MQPLRLVGETTLTGKNQVSLPANGVRQLHWNKGDRLLVETIGDNLMVLIRRPQNWTEAFAGQLTEVFGSHDEVLRWLEDERRTWEE